jgi:hypothetical protein
LPKSGTADQITKPGSYAFIRVEDKGARAVIYLPGSERLEKRMDSPQ